MRHNLIPNVLIFLIPFLISGCDTFLNQANTRIKTAPVEKPKLIVSQPDEISAKEVNWIIITEENYEQVFEELRTTNKPFALYALTDQGYENLALNINVIRTYIEQQKAIIAAYENYYVNADNILTYYENALKSK